MSNNERMNAMRAATVLQPKYFDSIRLTKQQLQAVRAVQRLGRPVSSNTIAHALAVSSPHACALLKAAADKGYLTRFKVPCPSGGIEWAYTYDLPTVAGV
jgi:hypothetical protein